MIGHRLYPRQLNPLAGPPAWEVMVWRGWTSWLIGPALECHPFEWTLHLHAGPFALSVQRVR